MLIPGNAGKTNRNLDVDTTIKQSWLGSFRACRPFVPERTSMNIPVVILVQGLTQECLTSTSPPSNVRDDAADGVCANTAASYG